MIKEYKEYLKHGIASGSKKCICISPDDEENPIVLFKLTPYKILSAKGFLRNSHGVERFINEVSDLKEICIHAAREKDEGGLLLWINDKAFEEFHDSHMRLLLWLDITDGNEKNGFLNVMSLLFYYIGEKSLLVFDFYNDENTRQTISQLAEVMLPAKDEHYADKL